MFARKKRAKTIGAQKMARLRNSKIAMGENFAQKLGGVDASIVAEYAGVSAEDMRQLRRDLRASDSELLVVKNRVAKKILGDNESAIGDVSDLLQGQVSLTLIKGDVAKATKTLFEFSESHDTFKVSGGVIDSQKCGEAELVAISKLPAKEVLLAKIVGSIVAPHRGIVGVLNGVNSKLVRLIAAIRDKKQ